MVLRDLPSVDQVGAELAPALPRTVRMAIARGAVEEARRRLLAGEPADAVRLAHGEAAQALLRRPTPVVNATGVLLHTNLGRAPLHPRAVAAARDAAEGYTNLEFDLASGTRGSRLGYVSDLFVSLTGAEAALVVNNNAGALFLALQTLAAGRSVPVSRGELIEIGGSYRLPDLMEATGIDMVEVGTTNRTRLSDYRDATDAKTAMLLKVHPSNYRIAGFTESVSLSSLAGLADELSLPLVFDAGSGLIDRSTPWLSGAPPAWLADEPGVAQSLREGADLVMFSGDKLFGGPQAGVVVGREALVAVMQRSPVARALRIGGPALAALAVTAELYADGRASEVPFWAMSTLAHDELEGRCGRVIDAAGVDAEVVAGHSTVGAGSIPGAEVPSPLIAVHASADSVFARLLAGDPPIVARRDRGSLLIDLRTVDPTDDARVAAALEVACRS